MNNQFKNYSAPTQIGVRPITTESLIHELYKMSIVERLMNGDEFYQFNPNPKLHPSQSLASTYEVIVCEDGDIYIDHVLLTYEIQMRLDVEARDIVHRYKTVANYTKEEN